MNARQLIKLGVPADCIKTAISCIQDAAKSGLHGREIKNLIQDVVENPERHLNSIFGVLAKALIVEKSFVRPEPIAYKSWGDLDETSASQMHNACSLPMVVAAATMPDAHCGYGICIGGVLALKGAVVPYCVGSDIACRMRLTVIDMPVDSIEKQFNLYREAIEASTLFGTGGAYKPRKNHPVMDRDWNVTKVTRMNKDRAWEQLGTSGSSNHFCDVGVVEVFDDRFQLAKGKYVAIMTHSGSRGTGKLVCDAYHAIAQSRLPSRYDDLKMLAWIDMESEAGQEYWAAMELMGEYAKAHHDIIHTGIIKHLGTNMLAMVENHHNYAYKETHFGQEVIVHRKGATPAGKGVMGVIPGSMGSAAYVVVGKGNPDSLNSASHGAGRAMSRRQANDTYNWKAVCNNLEKQGVRVLSASAEEVPGAYKPIDEVMKAQQDLVEPIAKFWPKIVKMASKEVRATRE